MKIVYQNKYLTVSDNGSDELFVTIRNPLSEDNPTIRITPEYRSLLITSGNYHLEPSAVSGMSAIRVANRR